MRSPVVGPYRVRDRLRGSYFPSVLRARVPAAATTIVRTRSQCECNSSFSTRVRQPDGAGELSAIMTIWWSAIMPLPRSCRCFVGYCLRVKGSQNLFRGTRSDRERVQIFSPPQSTSLRERIWRPRSIVLSRGTAIRRASRAVSRSYNTIKRTACVLTR